MHICVRSSVGGGRIYKAREREERDRERDRHTDRQTDRVTASYTHIIRWTNYSDTVSSRLTERQNVIDTRRKQCDRSN